MSDKNFPPKSERDQRFSDQLLVGAVLALLLVTIVVFRYTSAGSAPLGTTTVTSNGTAPDGIAPDGTPTNNINAQPTPAPTQAPDPSGMPPS